MRAATQVLNKGQSTDAHEGGHGGPLQPGDGVAGHALESGRLASTRDAEGAGLRPVLALPVVVGDVTVAVLEFQSEQAVDASDHLLAALTTVASLLSGVAERAGLRKKLARAEAHLQIYGDHSGCNLKVIAPDGTVLAQQPTNWPLNSGSAPVNAIQFIHPEDVPDTVRAWADALHAPGPQPPFECRTRQADGSWRWMEVVTINMLDHPDIQGIVTCSRDVTARKELDAALSDSCAALREVEAVAQIGTWHSDPVSRRLLLSGETCRIIGIEGGATSRALDELLEQVHPLDRSGVMEKKRLFEGGSGGVLEFRVLRPDGAIRLIRMRASGLRDSTGGTGAFRGTVLDVTDSAALEAPTGRPLRGSVTYTS